MITVEFCIGYGIATTRHAHLMRLGQSRVDVFSEARDSALIVIRYIVINRNGSANELEGSSRNFNPWSIFQAMKSVYNKLPEPALTHL